MLFFSFVCSLSHLLESRTHRIPLCILLFVSWLTAYLFFFNPLSFYSQAFLFFFIRGSGLVFGWVSISHGFLRRVYWLLASKKGMTTCVRRRQCHAEPEARSLALSLSHCFVSTIPFVLIHHSPSVLLSYSVSTQLSAACAIISTPISKQLPQLPRVSFQYIQCIIKKHQTRRKRQKKQKKADPDSLSVL